MKYYRQISTGAIWGFNGDGSEDYLITDDFEPLTPEETYTHEHPPIPPAEVEFAWLATEMPFIATNLLYIEDENPLATPPLVAKLWRNYRIKVMAWSESNPNFPDIAFRPVRPA